MLLQLFGTLFLLIYVTNLSPLLPNLLQTQLLLISLLQSFIKDSKPIFSICLSRHSHSTACTTWTDISGNDLAMSFHLISIFVIAHHHLIHCTFYVIFVLPVSENKLTLTCSAFTGTLNTSPFHNVFHVHIIFVPFRILVSHLIYFYGVCLLVDKMKKESHENKELNKYIDEFDC